MADSKVQSESESRKPLTHERLVQLMTYDAETGVFRWREGAQAHSRHNGKIAGVINASGGRVIRVDRRMYHAARLAWFYHYGRWPVGFVDHKNRDRSDDRIENLREADRCENSWNRNPSPRNTSGYRGVTLVKATGRWRALVRCRGKVEFLGEFERKEDAAKAYQIAARAAYGEFFPTD